MIKVGIIGGETIAAGELIRILLNHPDIYLKDVCSEPLAGTSVATAHRGLIGETDLIFTPSLDIYGLSAIFLCGEPWMARQFMESHDLSENPEIRIIDMTGTFRCGEHGMIYGLAEHRRKALVRGATRASVPSAVAMAIELALFPLAKNRLLNGTINATVKIAATENFKPSASAETTKASHTALHDELSALSTRFDPIAPAENRPDGEAAATEIKSELQAIQPSFNHQIALSLSRDGATPRGITATVEIPCVAAPTEIRHLFNEAYDDHSFTFVVDRCPSILDVANTNKCLIYIEDATTPDDLGSAAVGNTPSFLTSPSRIRITAVIDNLVKGSAGNAVHCLNLLFGLSERTGLTLKPSAF